MKKAVRIGSDSFFSCRFSAGGFRRWSPERKIARGAWLPTVESRGGRRIAVESRVSAAGRSFALRRPAVRVPLGRAPSQAPTRIGMSCAAGSASQRPAGRSLRARRPASYRHGRSTGFDPNTDRASARRVVALDKHACPPQASTRAKCPLPLAAGRSCRFRTARQGVRRRVRGSPRCPWPCVRRRRPPNRNRGTRAVRPARSAGR